MAAQHGAASTAQVRQSVKWRKQNSLIDERIWRRSGQRVVISRSSPDTWHQRVMVAALATAGVASYSTAARLHGFDGFNRATEIHIVLRYEQHRHHHHTARIHISRVFEASDQLLIQGIPTVIIPVCLIQIAEHSDDAMIKALEGTMRDGINPVWIRQVAARYDRPGNTPRHDDSSGRWINGSTGPCLGVGFSGSLPASLPTSELKQSMSSQFTKASVSSPNSIWLFPIRESASNARVGNGTRHPKRSVAIRPESAASGDWDGRWWICGGAISTAWTTSSQRFEWSSPTAKPAGCEPDVADGADPAHT